MLVPGVSADSNHESEFIPAAVIVRFVDAYATHEQAHNECDRCDNSMPEAAQKSGRTGARLFVFRV